MELNQQQDTPPFSQLTEHNFRLYLAQAVLRGEHPGETTENGADA
jgi:hypothetical protein